MNHAWKKENISGKERMEGSGGKEREVRKMWQQNGLKNGCGGKKN